MANSMITDIVEIQEFFQQYGFNDTFEIKNNYLINVFYLKYLIFTN